MNTSKVTRMDYCKFTDTPVTFDSKKSGHCAAARLLKIEIKPKRIHATALLYGLAMTGVLVLVLAAVNGLGLG